jgi:hypothetical protein
MTLERSVFHMARKTKAKSTAIETIGEGAGYYRYRYLMGAMQQAMMIATVRQACIKEDVHRMPEITTAWRAASMRMVELAAQEEGIADQIEIADLPKDVQARAAQIGADPLFQASFSSVPFAIKVVEIDKLVAPQREVNLDYAESLHASIPGKEINDILEFCVGPRNPPELRMLQTAMNQKSRYSTQRGYPHGMHLSDTLFRIHGTVEPWTIGKSVSSGCIRMINQDVIDLYQRTPVGVKVVVLSSRATAFRP